MMRRQLVAMAVMLGLICGIAPTLTALAQVREGGQGGRQTDRDGDGSSDPSQRIDKALQAYRQRLGQSQDHTRKEIDRLRKELVELIDLRYDMAISLAELRADMSVSGQPGQGGFGAGSGFRS